MSNFYSVNQFNQDIALQNQQEQFSGGNFNGRLFFKPGEQFQQYEMFNGQDNNETNSISNERLITNTLSSNPLSQTFLHSNNIRVIQRKIAEKVYQISNGQYRIGNQNEQQLLIIMRSMYLQYGKNQLIDIDVQVNELNDLVVEECVRIVVPNIQQQQGYIEDITSGIKVMPYAQNVSGRTTQLSGFDSVIPTS
jgi:hypothetical protein